MVEVVIPWGGECPYRRDALDWVRGRYPWRVTIATHPGGAWCKARAVTPALEHSAADIVVVADADVWTDGIHAAVAEVNAGAAWAVPHTGVFRLTAAATRSVLGGEPLRTCLELDERAYRGLIGGGIVIARREVLLDVPLDPRFTGWGQEDISWGCALTTLAGDPWRGRAPLFHLWHPPQPRMTRRYGTPAGKQLQRRYQQAMHQPEAMTRLLQEVRGEPHPTADPGLHDHAP